MYLSRDPDEHHQVILVTGRDLDVPSSVNQLSLRVTSLDELRRMERALGAEPAVGRMQQHLPRQLVLVVLPGPRGQRRRAGRRVDLVRAGAPRHGRSTCR